VELCQYNLNVWVHMRVEADFIRQVMDVYIDGDLKGSNIPILGMNYQDFELSTCPRSHTVYFDDVTILTKSIPTEPVLHVHPTSHDFGNMNVGETMDWNFYMENTGGETLSWNINEDIPWASVSPTSGATTTETDTITVHVDTSGLEAGQHYDGNIHVTSNVGDEDVYIELGTNAGNHPPNKPNTPSGPSSGNVGNSLTFSTSATDPDDDNVKYGWDWDGDYVVG